MKKRHIKFFGRSVIGMLIITLTLLVFISIYISTSLRQRLDNTRHDVNAWIQTWGLRIIQASGFTLSNIQVSGLKYTSKLDLLSVLNINYGDNMFNLDTQTLLKSLKKIGWIEHVTIHKRLPNAVEIIVQEYRPYALWQHKNHVSVIAETGVVIPKVDPKKFSDLPLVVGEKANFQCKALFSILMDYPGFKDMIVSAQYIQGRRWRLFFSSNVIVDLPEENIGDTIHSLYELHLKQKILERAVEIIDMRVPNKLIFKGSKTIRKTKKMTRQGV